jgi:hypothetical protein
MNRRRFDMTDIAAKRSDAGQPVQAIVVIGDQEKYTEIISRLAITILELASAGSHVDVFERLATAATVEALNAIEAAGIEMVTEPLFGKWSPSPASPN